MYYILFFFIILTLYKLYTNNNYDDNIDIIFYNLFIPLLIYYSVGHLLLTEKISKSIGWKSNQFQLELGFFTVSMLIISIYTVYNNKYNKNDIKIIIMYIWTLFAFFASINHIKDIIINNNLSFNNIYPIITSFIIIIIIIYNKNM